MIRIFLAKFYKKNIEILALDQTNFLPNKIIKIVIKFIYMEIKGVSMVTQWLNPKFIVTSQ